MFGSYRETCDYNIKVARARAQTTKRIQMKMKKINMQKPSDQSNGKPPKDFRPRRIQCILGTKINQLNENGENAFEFLSYFIPNFDVYIQRKLKMFGLTQFSCRMHPGKWNCLAFVCNVFSSIHYVRAVSLILPWQPVDFVFRFCWNVVLFALFPLSLTLPLYSFRPRLRASLFHYIRIQAPFKFFYFPSGSLVVR